MFGKQLRLKRFLGGIVVTAAIAVVAAPSAFSMTSTRSGSAGSAPDAVDRYLANHGGQATSAQGYRFVTDTLGGARHLVQGQQQVERNRFTSDTFVSTGLGAPVHGYNRAAYVQGGASPAVAKAIQARGYGTTTAASVQGYRLITDTLGGSSRPAQAQRVQYPQFTSDGFDGSWAGIVAAHRYDPSAYVPGGASPAVSKAIQDFGYGRTAGPVVAGSSSGSGIDWKDGGIVALGLLVLLLLLGGLRLRTHKPKVSPA